MTGAGAMEGLCFSKFFMADGAEQYRKQSRTGLTICHEISRIANTGVLANVMAKCVSSCVGQVCYLLLG